MQSDEARYGVHSELRAPSSHSMCWSTFKTIARQKPDHPKSTLPADAKCGQLQMSDWNEVKATDYLAREVYDPGNMRPIGFVLKPRLRVKASSRKQVGETDSKSQAD